MLRLPMLSLPEGAAGPFGEQARRLHGALLEHEQPLPARRQPRAAQRLHDARDELRRTSGWTAEWDTGLRDLPAAVGALRSLTRPLRKAPYCTAIGLSRPRACRFASTVAGVQFFAQVSRAGSFGPA